MTDLFKATQGIAPKIQEDFEPTDYSIPISCGAKAKILDAGRNVGVGKDSGKNYDMFFISSQLTDKPEDFIVKSGEEKVINQAKNRFMPDLLYSMIDGEFNGKPILASDNLIKLKNDLATMGYPLKEPSAPMENEEYKDYITSHLHGLKDKKIDVRCCPGKKDKNGNRKQRMIPVVRDVTASKANKSNVPF